jgi:hypothetical protein
VTTRQVQVERWSMISKKSFESVIASVDAAIGHPDMAAFGKRIAASKDLAEIETIVAAAIAPSGFMEFIRFDLGRVVGKKIIRFVIGNPVIMQGMVKHVPDAGSYAPVNLLVDERADGVHLSYDTMASLLAPYENEEALRVARDLDHKVESLFLAVA